MRIRLSLTLFSLAACMDPGRGGEVQVCIPGEQRACACPGGAPDGAQICADDGARYEPCFGCASAESSGGTGEDGGGATGESETGEPEPASSAPPEPDEPQEGEPSEPPVAWPPSPPPDGSAIVEQIAAERPDLLDASCVAHGGTNEFLFEVVRRLRGLDDRWGLNWKRGVNGDLSQDIVDYHWGDGVSENSRDVYIIDIIGNHCGQTPKPAWIDVTQATADAGTIGRWTLAGQQL